MFLVIVIIYVYARQSRQDGRPGAPLSANAGLVYRSAVCRWMQPLTSASPSARDPAV